MAGLDRRDIATHLVWQKISRFPELGQEIRRELMAEMTRRARLSSDVILDPNSQLASAGLQAAGEREVSEGSDLWNAFVDCNAARLLDKHEIDEIVNLVRKRRRARALGEILNQASPSTREVWQKLDAFCELPIGEKLIPPNELLGIRTALIEHLVSGHLPFLAVAKYHLTIRGVHALKPFIIGRTDGGGRIGGKAAGMLLAMAILHPLLEPEAPDLASSISCPKSYFIRSDVFDAFKESNSDELEGLRNHKYKELSQIASEYPEVCRSCLRADFPQDIVHQLAAMLDDFGDSPIIVRSSSLLEDNSGFAFSGKYKSIFLNNVGGRSQCMEDLLMAIKEIYASTYSPEVMTYRRERGLLDYNERMCLLVQEVVGSKRGRYFFPQVSGVAMTRNNFVWSSRIKPEDGLLRTVLGLGTRAVDRTDDDYPLLISLTQPLLRPETTPRQVCKYSQRWADALDLAGEGLVRLTLKQAAALLEPSEQAKLVSVLREEELISPLFSQDVKGDEPVCLTLQGLLKGEHGFASMMKEALHRLEEAFGRPLEVEFAYDGGKIYILQCRTISQLPELTSVSLPKDVPGEDILFATGHSYATALIPDVEYVVYVDPSLYAGLDTGQERSEVGRTVGRLNHLLAGKRFILIGPGRWGTNNPELGVKVSYGDINHGLMLVELAWPVEGKIPDLSYGTHFYHDLVEGNIFPLALVLSDPTVVFNNAFFERRPKPPPGWRSAWTIQGDCLRLYNIPALCSGRRLTISMDGSHAKAVAYLGQPA